MTHFPTYILGYVRTSSRDQDGAEQYETLQNSCVQFDSILENLDCKGEIPPGDREALVEHLASIRAGGQKGKIHIVSVHPDRHLRALSPEAVDEVWEWMKEQGLVFRALGTISYPRSTDIHELAGEIFGMLSRRMKEHGRSKSQSPVRIDPKQPEIQSLMLEVAQDIKQVRRSEHCDERDFLALGQAWRIAGAYLELKDILAKLAGPSGRDPGGWGSKREHWKVLVEAKKAQAAGHGYKAISDILNAQGLVSIRGKPFSRDTTRDLVKSPGFAAMRKPISIPSDLPSFAPEALPNGYFPLQLDAMAALCAGEDVLLVGATAAGKTRVAIEHHQYLSYRGHRHITVVVVPYTALALDLAHQYSGISITGSRSEAKYRARVSKIRTMQGTCLIVTTPLHLRPLCDGKSPLVAAIKKFDSRFLVVDEADCVLLESNFRKEYLDFRKSVKAIRPNQVLCMSATAPAGFLRDYLALQVLGKDKGWTVVEGPLDRPNLYLQHRQLKNVNAVRGYYTRLVRRLSKRGLRGVVFVDTHERVKQAEAFLTARGVRVRGFHSQLPNNEETIQLFRRGEVDVVVATSGFGRGLNLPIDFVVVAHKPENLSVLKQFVGRAGRRGNPGYCWWLTAERGDGQFLHLVKRNIQEGRLTSDAKAYLARLTAELEGAARLARKSCLRDILLKAQGQKAPEERDPKTCCGFCRRTARKKLSELAAINDESEKTVGLT